MWSSASCSPNTLLNFRKHIQMAWNTVSHFLFLLSPLLGGRPKFTSIIAAQRNVGLFWAEDEPEWINRRWQCADECGNETLQHGRAAPAESFSKVAQFPLMDVALRHMWRFAKCHVTHWHWSSCSSSINPVGRRRKTRRTFCCDWCVLCTVS